MSFAESEGMQYSVDGEAFNLNWQFWEKQGEALEALDSGEYDLVVFRGGYGSGKSVLGSRWIQKIAMGVPESDTLILAPDATKGAPTTFKVFFKQLPGENTVPDHGGDPENSPLVSDFHRVKNRLTWANGSVTRLGSADKWNRYAGGEFNAIWGDEVAHYMCDLFKLDEMLISRQRTVDGPNVTLWTSTGNGYNQFWQFVELQETPDGDPVTTRMHNVVADSRDNKFLSEKEKLTRKFENTHREAEALAGGFAALEGLVYSNFERDIHVISNERADELAGGWRIYGYDHGWDDPRVVLEIAKTPIDQYLVLDIFYKSEVPYKRAVNWLKQNGKPYGTVYAEHEPEHQLAFKKAGYPCEPAIRDLDEGISEVRERFDTDADGNPGILIATRCAELINELQSYKEEHVGKSVAVDHAADCLRYAIMGDTHGTKQETRRRRGGSSGRRKIRR